MIRNVIQLTRILLALGGVCSVAAAEARQSTTSGSIAIANLEQQLSMAMEPESRIAILLSKAQFLGDHNALDDAVSLAEKLPVSRDNLIMRARARAAVHRFSEALADLEEARKAGADVDQVTRQRAVILVATGRASDALPYLKAAVVATPNYVSRNMLAAALSELGMYAEADREYQAALDDLNTTSPFPYAWIHFARGLMWSENAGDRSRGESDYDQALWYLPEFAAANLHKAEIEFDRNELTAVSQRLMVSYSTSVDPEALALLARVEEKRGDKAHARRETERAAQQFEHLLMRQPLAFADHAAEFYLGPGADAERAWRLAHRNLINRPTPRAFSLAVRAAISSGRDPCELEPIMNSSFDSAILTPNSREEWERRAGHALLSQCL